MSEYILGPEETAFLEKNDVTKAIDAVKNDIDRHVTMLDYKWHSEGDAESFDYESYVADIGRIILGLSEQNSGLKTALHKAATMCGEDHGTVAVMATIYYLKSRSTTEKEETDYIR